jgi:hypothetical protein
MTDDDKALDKIIRTSMPFDFERKETLSDDKALVERLRWSDGWFFENPWDHVVYASDDPLEAADRIEAQAAEIERLREALALFGGEAAIEAKQLFIRMTAAAKCSGKRKELAERHYEASRKAAIARAALGETE